jgi:hypothetical protein
MNDFLKGLCSGCAKLLKLILVSFVLLGCQSVEVGTTGRTVPQNKWILLSEAGNQSGKWQTQDLILEYEYDRDHTHLYITGVIHFVTPIRNQWGLVEYFHLDLIPVDAQGAVLEMIPLTTTGEVNLLTDGPVDFTKTLTLPGNTAAMAFSYTGKGSGGGSYFDGGYGDFWEYPYY